MKMYKCVVCGHLFEEGEQASFFEEQGFGYEYCKRQQGCPICKGEYEEIKPCKICGSYVRDIDEEYCNDCKSKVKKRFSDFVDSSFTKEERQLLNELYDDKKI